MLFIITFAFFLCAAYLPLHSSSPTIFSKIIITSNQATCKKDPSRRSHFIFSYINNVVVKLTDGSTIEADKLHVLFDNPISKNSKKPSRLSHMPNHIHTIHCCGHVQITRKQHAITADNGMFDIPTNTCLLEGNVIIKQTKVKKSDIPVTIQSQRAKLDLTTMETLLEGSETDPVSTCFMFE